MTRVVVELGIWVGWRDSGMGREIVSRCGGGYMAGRTGRWAFGSRYVGCALRPLLSPWAGVSGRGPVFLVVKGKGTVAASGLLEGNGTQWSRKTHDADESALRVHKQQRHVVRVWRWPVVRHLQYIRRRAGGLGRRRGCTRARVLLLPAADGQPQASIDGGGGGGRRVGQHHQKQRRDLFKMHVGLALLFRLLCHP